MPTTNTRSSVRTRKRRTANTNSAKSSNGRPIKSSNGRSSKSETGTANGHSQLDKLFTDSLKDIYWAEKHLTKALPKMRKKATADEKLTEIAEWNVNQAAANETEEEEENDDNKEEKVETEEEG